MAIEQRGLNLQLEFRDPECRQVALRDRHLEVKAPDELTWIAETAGLHTFRLLRTGSDAEGAFQFLALDRRPSQGDDALRLHGEALSAFGFLQAQSTDEAKRSDAIGAFHKAAEIWEGLGVDKETDHLGETLFHLAGEAKDQKRWADGEAFCRLAAALCRQREAPRAEAFVLERLALIQQAADKNREALTSWQKARALMAKAGNQDGEAKMLVGIGALWDLFGESGKAIEAYEKAVGVAPETEAGKQIQAATYHNLGVRYRKLGDYEAAEVHYARALKLQEPDRLDTRRNLCWVYVFSEKLDRAQECFQDVLSAAREDENQALEAAAQNGLGRVALDQGRLPEARIQLEAAISGWRLLSESGDVTEPRALAEGLKHLGDLELAESDISAALAAFEEGAGRADRLDDRQLCAEFAIRRARALGGLDRLPQALDYSRDSLKEIEALRGLTGRAGLRNRLTAAKREYYATHIGLLKASERVAEAFETAERAHARGFLELLREARVDLLRNVDPALLEKRTLAYQSFNELGERRRTLLQEAAATAVRGPRAATGLDDDLNAAAHEVQDIEAEIRRQSPLYRALTAPEIPNLDELRAQLAPEDVVLEFILGDEESFLFLLTTASLELHPLPPRRSIEKRVRALHDALTARSRGMAGAGRATRDRQARMLAAELSETLLGPVAQRLEGRRLILVPDGALHLLPFAALPLPGDSEDGSGAWFEETLARRHTLTVQPSLSAVASLRELWKNRPKPAGSVAIWGDPVVSNDDPRLQGKAAPASPFPEPDEAFEEARTRGLLARLPHSRAEAEAVAELTGSEHLFLGFDASAASMGSIRRFGTLHFATHGLVNGDHPELSSLALSLFREDGSADPGGYLRLSRIYELDLDADLVVLSACSTGLGQEIRGEGLLGLTRGFLYAGARRVIASLWDVDDRATAELMTAFYRFHRRDGLPAAEALRRAQMELASRPERAAPWHWAGFQLYGEWR